MALVQKEAVMRAPADSPGHFATAVPGQWYHLGGVHDANAGTYTLYVNRQAQGHVLHQ